MIVRAQSNYRGLAGTGEQATMAGVKAAGTIVSGAAASGAAWATAAIPIIGPIVAGVTIGLSLLFARKGPQQKRATTAIVNDVEPHLQANLRGYFDGPRTQSSQQQAIQNFYAGWQYVLDQCGAAAMGEPGQRCISERAESSTTPYNWFHLYLDPIRYDTDVKADPDPLTAAVEGFLPATGASSDLSGLLIPAALILAAAFL